MRRTIGVFAAALACAAFAGQDARSLLVRVKEGDSARYTIKMIFEDSGQKVEMQGRSEDRIVKVDEKGLATRESVLFGIRLKISGQEIDVSDTKRETSVFRPNGEIVDILGTSPQDNRFAYATMIVVPEEPVKDGQTWTHDYAPKGGRSGKQEYQAIKVERVGTFEAMKVKFKTVETGAKPVKAEGHAWITLSDGRLAKMEASVDGVPMGEEGKPTQMTLMIERVP